METKSPRILLVEDDTMMQNMYAQKFTHAGYVFSMLPAPDDSFAKKVVEMKPDVILMDIHFEGSQTNGVEAAKALLNQEETKHIPIIFFTNGDIADLAEKAQKLQSTIGFIVKAEYTPSEVIYKVRELYDNYLNSLAQ